MGKVIIEFDEDDVTRLFQTQESLLEVMLRIERLLLQRQVLWYRMQGWQQQADTLAGKEST